MTFRSNFYVHSSRSYSRPHFCTLKGGYIRGGAYFTNRAPSFYQGSWGSLAVHFWGSEESFYFWGCNWIGWILQKVTLNTLYCLKFFMCFRNMPFVEIIEQATDKARAKMIQFSEDVSLNMTVCYLLYYKHLWFLKFKGH